jgi:hypothetical protein
VWEAEASKSISNAQSLGPSQRKAWHVGDCRSEIGHFMFFVACLTTLSVPDCVASNGNTVREL